MSNNWALAVHGGVDPRPGLEYSADERVRRHEALVGAMRAGAELLTTSGSSLDAVQAAVRVLEDAPEFNAGRGATLTHDGYAELDASIMDGRDRRAGAVAGLRRIRNPVDLARLVMERSAHVFLIGEGAEQFAAGQGVQLIDPEYLITEHQLDSLRKALEREPASQTPSPSQMSGTVGAVALDSNGNLAAATSTGGMTNKRYGRVGDTPVIGAGTYAQNGVCAVSATGWGEFFIRSVLAHDVYARVKYAGEQLEHAARHLIESVGLMGGYGGLIAVDAHGRIVTPYSTPRMAYGFAKADEQATIVVDERKLCVQLR